MSYFKSILAGICLFLFAFNSFGTPTGEITLLYNGKPLCFWKVMINHKHGDPNMVMAYGNTDENGVVKLENVVLNTGYLYIQGRKKTSDGAVKEWKIYGFLHYVKEKDKLFDKYGSYQGAGGSEKVTFDFADYIVDRVETPQELEIDWGLAPKFNECSESSGDNNSLTKDVNDMRALQKDLAADRKAQLEQQNAALKQKIDRLNQRVEKTKNEQAALTPNTIEHSNKSYDLRDLEIERDIAELELDRNLDEQSRMGQGQLSKSDRQRYNDKMDALTAEQKQLAKNRKDGVMYGQAPLSKAEKEAAEKKAKEEKEAEEAAERKAKEEEDNMPIKIFTPEELANMSAFDLKKTKMANANGINRRKVKLKTKGAFLTEDVKTRLNEQILALEKQIEDIKAVLALRNEKEE